MEMDELQKRVQEHEQFRPTLGFTHEGKKIEYLALSSTMVWRSLTLFSKEPDTLKWIAGFKPGATLVDIGANVGMYTIWAAITRDCKVFAFEPESQNYAMLNANLHVNKLSEKVRAYCLALSDETAFDVLNLCEFVQGSSNHTFKERLNFNLEAMNPVYQQGCFATTLDALVAQGVVPIPQHIKIDVDGIEHRVVKGMETTLKHPDVQSVLIEINTHLGEHQAIITRLQESGFNYSEAEVEESLGRQKGSKFEGVGNFIFYRN